MDSVELKERSQAIRARFSAAAGTYDACAEVQGRVADWIVEWLQDVPCGGPILEIGCGTGLLTRRLLAACPAADIHALDLSARMIRQAAQILPPTPRVNWIEADVRDHSSPIPYPLIVSSSSLHWIEPLSATLSDVTALAVPGSFFVASIMLRNTLHELHHARRQVAPRKEPAALLPDFDQVLQCLESLQWRIVTAREELLVENYPSADGLLRTLHDQGVTGETGSHTRFPLNRGELNRLRHYYDAHYRHSGGGVTATYQVGLIKALKL